MRARFAVLFLLFWVFFFSWPARLYSYPDQVKGSLSLVTTQASDFLISDDDRYLYLAYTDNIKRVDTQTWDLTTDQVPQLTDTEETGADLAGNIQGLALKGSFLYAAQNDGDLVKIDLDLITDADPTVYSVGTGDLGDIVADPETGDSDDKLYIADTNGKQIKVFDISAGTSSTTSLLNGTNTAVAPTDLVFLTLPTLAGAGGTTDKIFIGSDEGLVFMLNEGATTTTALDIDSANGDNLNALSISPDGNFVFVVNASDSTVHVLNSLTGAELDTDAITGNGTTPISLAMNDALSAIAVTTVTEPDDVYAYVSGVNGISVIDCNINGSTFISATVLDMNDEGVTDTEDDPLTLSGTAGPLVASSVSSAFLVSALADGKLAVLSERPLVTINSVSILDSASATATTLGAGDSFTITFQSDETGTYSVRLGGNTTTLVSYRKYLVHSAQDFSIRDLSSLSGLGTELTSGTVDTASTAQTTAAIAYNDFSSSFAEGANRIFIFVTDSDSKRGWDATDVTADTPPTAVTINSVGFGNGRLYLNFDRLTIADIASYNIYADVDQAPAESTTTVAKIVTQPASGSEITAAVDGLTNGTLTFLSIEAVDDNGNVGPRSTSSATPEATVGLTGALGETGGCSLILE